MLVHERIVVVVNLLTKSGQRQHEPSRENVVWQQNKRNVIACRVRSCDTTEKNDMIKHGLGADHPIHRGAMFFLCSKLFFFHFRNQTIIFPLWIRTRYLYPFGHETNIPPPQYCERLVKGGDILDTCIGLFPLLWGLLDKQFFPSV